ncbi:hypothetical protein TA3x_001803 [Tundrisphaera sp. TA3]|uniref:hypothetical protein n=1 Tax=Tundrisphaera sp. TA3 TaxID=3435775 RepID=UPI003EBA7477
MTIRQGFLIILSAGIGFAAGGGGVGYALARFAPFYYRGVFQAGVQPGFDPDQVGVGLGITQGLIAGLVVGSVIVLAVALSGPRRQPSGKPGSDEEIDRFRPRGWMYAVLGLLGGALPSLPVGLVVGLLMGDWGCKNRRFDEEVAAITPILAADPAFTKVNFWMNSADGCATLSCVAKTRDDRDRLLPQLVSLMGQARAKDLIQGVSVEDD